MGKAKANGAIIWRIGAYCSAVVISDVELKVKDSWENGVCVFDKLRIVIPGDLKQRIMAIPIPTVSDLQSFLAWSAVNQHNEEQKEEDLRYGFSLLLQLAMAFYSCQGFGGCNMHISGTPADHFVVGFTGFETNLLPRLLSFKSCLQLAWEQGFMGVFCNPVLQRLPTQLISKIEFHKYKALVCEIKWRLSREWALPYLQGRQRLC
uniref:Uncharacterized protein n=2 Tax=Salix viminalis TaxID=40686 RepID=A0A6N2K5A0_SALVM